MNSEDICTELKYIAQYLKSHIAEIERNPGLFTGYLGALVFFIEYNKREPICGEFIDRLKLRLIEDIRGGEVPNLDLASGLSGYLFTILLLEENNYLDKGTTQKLFSTLKPTFIKVIEAKIKKEDFDFLYGYIGILYVCEMIEDGFCENNGLIELILCNSRKSLVWRQEYDRNVAHGATEKIDYGFAHGFPSLISFLLKIHKKSNNKNLEIELYEATDYLNSIAKWSDNSYYTYSNLEKSSTRLAWCYGDLPNAMLLSRLGVGIGHAAATQLSDKILRSIKYDRLVAQTNGVVDNCLCHGTLGVSLLLKYINKTRGIETYEEASQHWLEMANTQHFNIENKYFPNSVNVSERVYNIEKFSLLEGMTGCGLAYLSLINKRRLMWEDLFMIN